MCIVRSKEDIKRKKHNIFVKIMIFYKICKNEQINNLIFFYKI